MHHFPFSQQPPQDSSQNGYRIQATKDNFPALQGMSLYKLVLNAQAVRCRQGESPGLVGSFLAIRQIELSTFFNFNSVLFSSFGRK